MAWLSPFVWAYCARAYGVRMRVASPGDCRFMSLAQAQIRSISGERFSLHLEAMPGLFRRLDPAGRLVLLIHPIDLLAHLVG